MIILNLGCGTRLSAHPHVMNIDWSIRMRIQSSVVLSVLAPLLIGPSRLKKSERLTGRILVHDMRKGIPYPENSVDAVYHSHFLEHIQREHVPKFLCEVRRVLRPGGIHRIVVPDWARLTREYLDHYEECGRSTASWPKHDGFVAKMIEQCVRSEAVGTGQQKPFRRFIENLLLGDARARGEIHRWMYDHCNLGQLLLEAGFGFPRVMDHRTSGIVGWNAYQLDTESGDGPYKPGSLYMEAVKS